MVEVGSLRRLKSQVEDVFMPSASGDELKQLGFSLIICVPLWFMNIAKSKRS